MNTSRRVLTALLITLSCLFAIQPAGAESAAAPAAGDEVCSNIGPTVFSLGLGTGVVMNVPACHESGAKTTRGANDARVVRVPIEGSILAMNDQSASALESQSASTTSRDATASQQTGGSRQSPVQ